MTSHRVSPIFILFAVLGIDGASARGCGSDHGLRGQALAAHAGSGCEHMALRADLPEHFMQTGTKDSDSSKGVSGKKKKLEKDATGSPVSSDMKKIDEATTKTQQRMYKFPLLARLAIVSLIVGAPLTVIGLYVYRTEASSRASSVQVRTAIHCGFSFSMGWFNTILLLRYQVFATMTVGNTILMGVSVVCNGGLSPAEEKAYWSWQGTHVKALCPAQFENPAYYLILIVLFVLGSIIQGLLQKNFQWSSRAWAPICTLIIICVEMMNYFEVFDDSKWDVYVLSPIFGIIVSISQHCGVGSVPWCATGNTVSAGFNIASWLSGFKSADLQKVITNTLLWFWFVAGVMMGTFFHSNRTMIFNALYMQGLLWLNGVVYQPEERDPFLLASTTSSTDARDSQAAEGVPVPKMPKVQSGI